jgi:CHAT domain
MGMELRILLSTRLMTKCASSKAITPSNSAPSQLVICWSREGLFGFSAERKVAQVVTRIPWVSGIGVSCLSRSLIAAGVPSVIVSLWAILDAPTRDLMSVFYQNLQRNPDKAHGQLLH